MDFLMLFYSSIMFFKYLGTSYSESQWFCKKRANINLGENVTSIELGM